MEPPVRHVFFDATNTLLGVRGSVGEIYARAAAEHGLEAPAGAIEEHFQAAIQEIPQPLGSGLSDAEILRRERAWWRELAAAAMAPFGPFPRFEDFFDTVFELFRTPVAWELLPSTTETLSALRSQGRRLGIISDMDSRLLDVLAAFDLAPAFDVVCLSFHAGYRKPDRRLFEAAMSQCGGAPTRAAHVGDSVRSDIQGALAAGMHAIHLDTAHAGGTPPAAHVVHDLADLPALLDRLDSKPASARLL